MLDNEQVDDFFEELLKNTGTISGIMPGLLSCAG
jgi:hypothetical protein